MVSERLFADIKSHSGFESIQSINDHPLKIYEVSHGSEFFDCELGRSKMYRLYVAGLTVQAAAHVYLYQTWLYRATESRRPFEIRETLNIDQIEAISDKPVESVPALVVALIVYPDMKLLRGLIASPRRNLILQPSEPFEFAELPISNDLVRHLLYGVREGIMTAFEYVIKECGHKAFQEFARPTLKMESLPGWGLF